MKNYWKAGILTLTLVLPALLLIFLHLFAENQYALPKYFPKTDRTGNVLLQNKDTLFVTTQIQKQVAVANLYSEDSITNKKIAQSLFVVGKKNDGVEWIEKADSLKQVGAVYMKQLAALKGLESRFSTNGKLFLIDQQGIVRGIFNGLDPEEIDRLSAEIKVLKEIQKNEKQ